MKIQILVSFILAFSILNATARTFTRTNRQISSQGIIDETNLTSNRLGWSWGLVEEEEEGRSITRRPSTTSTARSPTTISYSTSTDFSSGLIMKPSTLIPIISTPSPTIDPAIFNMCMTSCIRTPEYNPLCADLGKGERKQYRNQGEMICAKSCGEKSTLIFRGACVEGG